MKKTLVFLFLTLTLSLAYTQNKLQTINQIVSEANNNSKLEALAHELMDQI